ncbi:hypothetical protein SM764_13345 [Pseudophaeobacter sp. 1A16562]|uniref:calcium-binding protein n=1 Tax=Pseudophaeobacter sp. 1A16562 TaxID=3098143 RepID=UPI0034D5AC1B
MTITITTGNSQVTDFTAYIEDFSASFESAGRGVFSNGLGGDYAGAEAQITDTATPDAQAYILRDDIVYSMSTHTLSGTVSGIELGYGATATDAENGTQDIALEQLDYSIKFAPAVDGADASAALIYGMLDADFEPLIDQLKAQNIRFFGSGGDDSFSGYANDDRLKGGAGNDNLQGNRGEDVLIGAKGRDTLLGGGHDDKLKGGVGRDALKGGKGEDTLLGGAHNDKLFGGSHNDVLNGGGGRDKLVGGGGEDTFIFKGDFGRDVVRDFTIGEDVLDLSALTGEATSLDAFVDSATDTGSRVIYDMGDDGQNVIILNGVSLDDLTADDFLF